MSRLWNKSLIIVESQNITNAGDSRGHKLYLLLMSSKVAEFKTKYWTFFCLELAKTLFLAYSFCHFENCLQVFLIYSLVNLSPVTSEHSPIGQKRLSFIYCFITSTFSYPAHAEGTRSDFKLHMDPGEWDSSGHLTLSWACLRPPPQRSPHGERGSPLPRCTTFQAAGIVWSSQPGFPAFYQVMALAAKGPETTGETWPRISSPGQSSSQPPADRTIQTHRKARHVSWALKKGTFPECLVCARQCAKWFICITSLKPH